MILTAAGRGLRGWWSVAGAVLGATVLAWVLWRIDYHRLAAIVAQADVIFLLLVPLAVAAEQLVRAWKWRQLLHPIRPVGTLRLFGAIMAGYLAALLVPFGVSPLVRAWLIARLEALTVGQVLATVAVDRLVDGIVFSGLVAVALFAVAFPDPGGGIRLGMGIGGAGGLALFVVLLLGLVWYRGLTRRPSGSPRHPTDRLPARFRQPVRRFLEHFAEGIVWPRAPGRRVGIVLASVAIKLLAATHFLWAGLAFGLLLRPAEYLFLVVFLGFLVVIAHVARIPGSFIVGAVFALGLFGVGEERALAMALVVQIASVLSIAGIGAVALWRNGLALADLRNVKGSDAERA